MKRAHPLDWWERRTELPLPVAMDKAIWLPTSPESHREDVDSSDHSVIGVPHLLPEFRHSRGGRLGEECTHYHAWLQSYDHRPSHLYNTGMEHVGFSPTRQTLLAPSAKRREVLSGSHELHPTKNP